MTVYNPDAAMGLLGYYGVRCPMFARVPRCPRAVRPRPPVRRQLRALTQPPFACGLFRFFPSQESALGVQIVAPRELKTITLKKMLDNGVCIIASFSARRRFFPQNPFSVPTSPSTRHHCRLRSSCRIDLRPHLRLCPLLSHDLSPFAHELLPPCSHPSLPLPLPFPLPLSPPTATSHSHSYSQVPESLGPPLTKGKVRATLFVGGGVIVPKADGGCTVTFLTQLDFGGQLPQKIVVRFSFVYIKKGRCASARIACSANLSCVLCAVAWWWSVWRPPGARESVCTPSAAAGDGGQDAAPGARDGARQPREGVAEVGT